MLHRSVFREKEDDLNSTEIIPRPVTGTSRLTEDMDRRTTEEVIDRRVETGVEVRVLARIHNLDTILPLPLHNLRVIAITATRALGAIGTVEGRRDLRLRRLRRQLIPREHTIH